MPKSSSWLAWRNLVHEALVDAYGEGALIIETSGHVQRSDGDARRHIEGFSMVKRAPRHSDFVDGDYVVGRWRYYPGEIDAETGRARITVFESHYGLTLQEACDQYAVRNEKIGITKLGTFRPLRGAAPYSGSRYWTTRS